MSDELNDEDPFAEGEEPEDENLISDKMVKKATFLIHKLANQKKRDYLDIQKKCKKLFAYTNLAKVSLDDGHKIIDKLIELTGGEEAKPELPVKPDDGFGRSAVNAEPREEETTVDDDFATTTMRGAVRAAVDITLKEIVAKDVPVQGLGGVVLEISKVIFEAKMSEDEAK